MVKTILKTLVILSVYLFVFSCNRDRDDEKKEIENIPSKELVSVKINFSGAEWGEEISKNIQLSGKDSGVESKSLSTTKLKDNTLQDINSFTSEKKDNLPNETKYTVLAYKKVDSTYSYHKRKDFTVGETDPKMELYAGESYTLVVVSVGTEKIPNISNENDLNTVNFPVDGSDPNEKFLYQKIENFTPDSSDIDIKLKGSTGISITLDVSEFSLGEKVVKISHVSDAVIKYKRPKAIKLGENSYVFTDYEEASVSPIVSHFSDNSEKKYLLEFPEAFIVENTEIKLYIKSIQIDELSDINSIDGLSLNDVKAGNKYEYVVKMGTCGAYTGPNKTNFREFICHNLGEGSSERWTDKFVGDRYAWGKNTIVNKQSGNPYEEGDIWKDSENPCPAGFRVPTIDEWKDVLDESYNPRERLNDSKGNSIGWKIGSRMALFHTDDYRSYIWSTTVINNVQVYTINVKHDGIDKNYQDGKHFGQAVRCIRKLPNE